MNHSYSRAIARFALLAGWLLAAGCQLKLPNLQFSEYHADTSIMGFKSVVDATGIVSTATHIKAHEVKWNLSWPGFTRTMTFKEFQQERQMVKSAITDSPVALPVNPVVASPSPLVPFAPPPPHSQQVEEEQVRRALRTR